MMHTFLVSSKHNTQQCRMHLRLHNIANTVLPSNFVLKLLAWNYRNVITNALVGVEIKSQTWIIFLNDNPCGLFHSLSPYSALKGETTLVVNTKL